MKTKIYAIVLLVYIIIIGRFFKDQIYGDSIGLATLLYFAGLFVLASIFMKNYRPVRPKRTALTIPVYGIISLGIILFFAWQHA